MTTEMNLDFFFFPRRSQPHLSRGPQGGRAGAWVVAIAAVAAWNYYENKDNGKKFTNEDVSDWNKDKKANGKNA